MNDEFGNRPIDVFMCFGYSNEARPLLMGELLKRAGRFCAHWCVTEQDLDRALNEGRQRIFALLHVPHYRRININKIMEWQSKAKISISLNGAGRKCFRHAESPHNSIMACQEPCSIVWSYPWIGGVNCIELPSDEVRAVDYLYDWLRISQGSLYPIYLKGIENNRRYVNDTYAREYILPKILEVLK